MPQQRSPAAIATPPDLPALGLRLARHLRRGEAAARRALAVAPERQAGFVEFVATDQRGRLWLGGWMETGLPVEGEAVVLDGGKHPAGFVLARHARPDLPEGATGVLGVLETPWRPAPDTEDALLILPGRGPAAAFLRFLPPLRVVPLRELAPLLRGAMHAAAAPELEALSALLHAPDSWVPGFAAPGQAEVHADLDAAVLVPGFGCAVEGWALTGGAPVAGFTLLVGASPGVTVPAEPDATTRRARPDLAPHFPALAPQAGTAGFAALFRFEEAVPPGCALTLRLDHADGTATIRPVPPARVLRLEDGPGEAALLRCFPAPEHEAFAPRLAAALLGARPAPALQTVIPAAPAALGVLRLVDAARSAAFLAAEEAMRARATLAAAGASLLFLAPAPARAALLPLVRQLRQEGLEAGLVLHDGPPPGPLGCARALREAGLEGFVLVDPAAAMEAAPLAEALRHAGAAAPAVAPGRLAPGLLPLPSGRPAMLAWRTEALEAAGAWPDATALPLPAVAFTRMPPAPGPLRARLGLPAPEGA